MPPHLSPSANISSGSLDTIAGGSCSSSKSVENRLVPSPNSAQSAQHHAAQAAAAHAAAAAHRWPSPYPHIGGASPYGPPMPPRHWGLPGASGPGASFKPYGPIPMGYQLATDPLTGQILLIPTGKYKCISIYIALPCLLWITILSFEF